MESDYDTLILIFKEKSVSLFDHSSPPSIGHFPVVHAVRYLYRVVIDILPRDQKNASEPGARDLQGKSEPTA